MSTRLGMARLAVDLTPPPVVAVQPDAVEVAPARIAEAARALTTWLLEQHLH